jgi:hypothetical protein
VAARVSNESNRAYRSDAIKDKKGNYLFNAFLLKGFSLNAFVEFFNATRAATDKKSSTAERMEAVRHIGTYGTQIVVFNFLKLFVMKELFGMAAEATMPLLYGLASRGQSDEEKEKEKGKNWSKIGVQTVADGAFGGLPAYMEATGKAGVNWLYKHLLTTTDKSADGTYQDDAFKPLFSGEATGFGGVEMAAEAGQVAWDALSLKQNSKLTAEANAAKQLNDELKLAAFIFRSGDLLKFSYALEKEIGKHKKEPVAKKKSNTMPSFGGKGNKMPKF